MDIAAAPHHSSRITGPWAGRTENEGRSTEMSPGILGQSKTSIMLCECVRKKPAKMVAAPAANEAFKRPDVRCQCRAGVGRKEKGCC